MKPAKISLFFVFIFTLIGCSGLKTDIFLNENGSGAYHLKLDMSEMISGFKNTMENISKDTTNAIFSQSTDYESEYESDSSFTYANNAELDSIYGIDSTVEGGVLDMVEEYYEEKQDGELNDPMQEGSAHDQMPEVRKTMMQIKMMELMESDDIDTIITVYSMVPDTVISKLKNPELLKNVQLGVMANKVEQKAAFDFGFSFKKLSDLKATVYEISQAQYFETGDTTDMSTLASSMESMDHLKFDPKTKTVTIEAYSMENDPGFSQDMSGFSEMSEDELKQTLSMFGLEDLSVVYHLPSKVKSVTGDVTYKILDNNAVEIIIPMIKMIKTKMSPGYKIQY